MAATPFLFGKLPTHGDFVTRGLSAAAERVWDDWASAEIAAAREALGDDFDAAHDASPPWVFVGGPGVLGDSWRCGAATASIDSAGRRYLVVAGHDGLTAAEAAFTGFAGAMAAEGALRRILVEGLDADAAVAAVEDGLAPPEALSAAAAAQACATTGVWWACGDIIAPVATDAPAPNFVLAALSRVSALLKEAA